jgi:uncharacterized protein YecT (DUF1311 family)
LQLLEIAIRQLILVHFITLASSHALADNDRNRESITNPEIIKCIQESFEKIDATTNEQYRFLIKRYDEKQKRPDSGPKMCIARMRFQTPIN